jgi:transposase, IS5 family
LANWTTRALFVVDRNTLAIQAEDTFAEHLPQLPSYRVTRTGRRFQDEKRVTIVTLQTLSIATTLHRSAGGQFIAHAKALPGNPYDGHTLATVIPEIETQIGASLTRIVADRGYRGHNAPPGHKFRVYISGQRRRVTETIKRELRRRSAVEPVIGHAKAEHRMGRNYLAGTHGDAANAVLAAAGYNFRRLLEWLALFLSAVLAALKTAATRQGPFKLV